LTEDDSRIEVGEAGLNARTLVVASPTAQAQLLGLFRDQHRLPFHYGLISEALRGIYDYPHSIAYEFARAYCVKSGRGAEIPQIAIDYYTDGRFRASAITQTDVHLIAVSAGTPALLTALFFEVFRSTHPFSEEYEVEEDVSPGDYRFPLKLVTESVGEPGALAAGIEGILRDTIPDERWQRIWAVTLAELAMIFVFGHELGHLVQGHTRVLRDQRRGLLVEVASESERARQLLRIQQAWELDADQTAFSFLWSYMIGNRDNRRRLIRRLQCGRDGIPEIKLIARACYAVSFVFFLLGQTQREVNATETHPSALVRITFLIAFAQQLLEALVPGVDPQRIEAEVQRSHVLAEAAWKRLGLQFGVDDFAETIEDLPLAVRHLQRRRERVGRAFGGYVWRFRTERGR
jgi:hypothetical protein